MRESTIPHEWSGQQTTANEICKVSCTDFTEWSFGGSFQPIGTPLFRLEGFDCEGHRGGNDNSGRQNLGRLPAYREKRRTKDEFLQISWEREETPTNGHSPRRTRLIRATTPRNPCWRVIPSAPFSPKTPTRSSGRANAAETGAPFNPTTNRATKPRTVGDF